MPVVVIDGPDNTGKTILACAIKQVRPDAILRHLTYRHKHRMHWYHTAAVELGMRDKDKLTVLDRWWPSEQIYAWAYRDGSPWPWMGRVLDRYGLRRGVTYVIANRINRFVQMAAQRQAARTRKEMYQVDERTGKIHDAYSALYGLNSWRPDWTYWCLDRMGVSLMEFAEKVVDNAYSFQATANATPIAESSGTWHGGYFFVGDVANPQQKRYLGPWVGFSGASTTMAEAIAGYLNEGQCFWTNIRPFKPDDGEHQQQLNSFLDAYKGTVIALGADADKFLGSRPHSHLPHPAYVSRFLSGRGIYMKDLIGHVV